MKTNPSNINLPNGYTVEHHKIVYNTNHEAIKLAERGVEDGTIIISDEQIKGRGRYKRIWHSPKGNLYFSIIITKFVEVFPLSFIAALSVGKTLEEILRNNDNTTSKVQYKWPNDILINSKKISGILLESMTSNNTLHQWIVIGIGINMHKAPAYATTIKEHCHNFALSNIELLEKVINNFNNIREHYTHYGFTNIRDIWLKQTCHLNSQITVRSYNHTYSGQFITIDTKGNMIMKQHDKTICITSGEIFNIT